MSQQFDVADEQEPQSIHRKVGKIERRVANELQKEAKYYAKLLPEVLADIGLDHWIRKESRPSPVEKLVLGKSSRQKVKILHVAFNEANIFLRIDALRLPYKVTIPTLKDEEVLETLSVACGLKVSFALRDYGNGAWFVINRDGVFSSIPREFSFRDAINSVPAGAPPLRYCAGLGQNLKLVMCDIATMPHLLIAGASGMGKSVHLGTILTQIMWRNDPNRVKFLMVDLKGGMELIDFAPVPHLWRPIITRVEDVCEALRAYHNEMERRQKMMAGKARNLEQWNRMTKDKLPYIILVVDELAMLLRNPLRDISDEAKVILGGILATSRATGGHSILCTQRPSVDVIDGYIKANIPSRVAFGMATQADSRVIIDTSEAAGIDIKGRAWMLTEANRVQLQAPWMSPTLIKRTIKAICERPIPEQRGGVDAVALVRASLDKFGGSMARRDLVSEFKGRISQHDLEDLLAQIEGEIIDVDGSQYLVKAANGKGRHLEQVIFDEPALEGVAQ